MYYYYQQYHNYLKKLKLQFFSPKNELYKISSETSLYASEKL